MKKLKKEKLVGVWCYLSNRLNYISDLMEKDMYKQNEMSYGLLAEERTAIDMTRDYIKQSFGYNDNSLFVREVVDKYYTYNTLTHLWFKGGC